MTYEREAVPTEFSPESFREKVNLLFTEAGGQMIQLSGGAGLYAGEVPSQAATEAIREFFLSQKYTEQKFWYNDSEKPMNTREKRACYPDPGTFVIFESEMQEEGNPEAEHFVRVGLLEKHDPDPDGKVGVQI